MNGRFDAENWQALMLQDFIESELPDASSKRKQVERIVSPLLEFENVEYRIFEHNVYDVEVFYLDKLVRITFILNSEQVIELSIDRFLDAIGRDSS